MSEALVIRSADQDDIPTIGYLAHRIWPETYRELIPAPQLEYMLDLFYSPEALEKQILEWDHRFIIAEIELEEVGFASFSKVTDATWKLQKLYVLPEVQGKGVGRALLDMVEEEVRTHYGAHLILNVKKDNPAIRFYEAMGFRIEKDEVIDIGNGYVMDDFVMGKNV
ncbi:GNAT family N-acetyltransferase [Flavihumibacter petaseus]|uniref:Putative acetyltransferase n=1 Tax=Flavihumibacter petaseus NBRC 106054 TaxID=1220578 RepID=A0A0E9N116_9BACT|nr:GNAT family N-acetyltransferase [Flavihumibacter petaseus]GAO43717.1 putative acetyltransferase [Flavihumibacter petaseus NBRC 106054]